MDKPWLVPVIIVLIVVVVLCCCLLGITAAGYLLIRPSQTNIVRTPVESFQIVTATPIVIRPDVNPVASPTPPLPLSPEGPTVAPPLVLRPTPQGDHDMSSVSQDTLKALEDTIVPINDLPDLAERLEGKTNIPRTVPAPAVPFQKGDRQTFWVTNVDTNNSFQVDAVLQYITDHVYFWIEDGVDFNRGDLQDLAETFENKIYPKDREFFGSEWTPGVDNDPHLYILYAGGLGYSLAGYFSSADEYSPLAHEYSNAHEMFLLNADNVGLEETFTYGVLAHEFQHMIHWYRDRNETSWLNEGFSELAAFLNGYYESGFDWLYTQDPDLQLNDWPNDSSATTPHYGASFLFLTYFLDRFGEDATKQVVADQNNGLSSIDEVLAQIGAKDPLTNAPIGADDVFQDWVITSYLQDGAVGDGRFTYHNYAAAPKADNTESFTACPINMVTRDVNQYGVDYIRLNCSGDFNLHFEGSIQVGVVPQNAHSGQYAFWSNKGDESDMTLTQTFDFSNVSGPLTINYWTWYDLETDYDYLYLAASEDGSHWQILKTPSSTDKDPSGNSYGWGYNGLSGGDGEWIQERVDISQYAGKKVQLRFEYVTDAAVNGEGFLLDDVAIPEIGYSTDFETDDGGWESAGWVRMDNLLPQTYRLALIYLGSKPRVEYVPLAADVSADVPLHFDSSLKNIILVVSGTTRFTRQTAPYQLEVQPAP